MTEIKNYQDHKSYNIAEASASYIATHMKETCENLAHTSKDKYDLKTKLIENATDITTKEKLDALDKNYERHNQEVWRNIILITTFSLSIIGVIAMSPAINKGLHQF